MATRRCVTDFSIVDNCRMECQPQGGWRKRSEVTKVTAGIAEGGSDQPSPTLTWFLCLGLRLEEPEELLDAADIEGFAVGAAEETEGATRADGGRWYEVCCIICKVVGCWVWTRRVSVWHAE